MSTLETSYDLTPTVALSDQEIAAVAYESGFQDLSRLATITAIAGPSGGQSGGSPGAIGIGNPSAGDSEYSVGLSQINISPEGGSPSLGTEYGPSLLTPAGNLAAAAQLSGQGADFTPWQHQDGETSAQVQADYAALDPQAQAAAADVLGWSPQSRQQLALQVQAKTAGALPSPLLWPAPPSPGQLPPGLQGSTTTTIAPVSGPPSSVAGVQTSGTTGSATGSGPVYAALVAIDRWMALPSLAAAASGSWWSKLVGLLNPLAGVAASAATGGSGVVSWLRAIAIRLAFALPAGIGLLLALGLAGVAFAGELVARIPVARAVAARVA